MFKAPYDSVVLAAGRGRRLGKLTEHRPKPMLHVLGKPLLQWQVEYLRHGGLEPIVTAWWLAPQIVALGSAMGFDVAVADSVDYAPGGCALSALDEAGDLRDVFVVLLGDTMVPIHPQKLAERLQRLPDSYHACMLVRRWTEHDADKGVLVPSAGNWAAIEKPKKRYHEARVWMGAAALRPSALIEPHGEALFHSIRPDCKFAIIESEEPELDIGTFASLRLADKYVQQHYITAMMGPRGDS